MSMHVQGWMPSSRHTRVSRTSQGAGLQGGKHVLNAFWAQPVCLHERASYALASHSTLNRIASLPLQVWTGTDPPVSLPSNALLRAPENSRFV